MSMRLVALSLLGAAGCLWLSAEAATAGPPAAFNKFCASQPKECQVRGDHITAMPMSDRRWSELRRVNDEVNRMIRQVTDKQNYGRSDVWSLAADGKGDCEDFALLKRHKLMQLGWPSGVLLTTVVRDRQGLGHAILTVSTAEGDYVLDNKRKDIASVSATGYRFFSRQSASDPRKWVSLTRGGQVERVTASTQDRESAL